jgi:predicted dehydrogenase
LRVGVVGVGHLGRHHARLYAAMPGVKLVGVADRDAGRAGDVGRAYGCRAVTEVAELLGEIDAASVAVPTEAHAALVTDLLAAGVDVLVEKPIARSLDEADAMLAAAERHGRLLMVGHTERFNPALAALAREVDQPRFFEVHRLSPFSARSTDIDVVLDLMIHDLDLLLHLDGSEVASIDAVGVQALTDRTDIANARIRMASGAVANLTASRISAEPVRRVRVFQSRTYLACDTVARTAERYTVVPGADGRPAIRHATLAVAAGEPLGVELAAFIGAVRRRVPPPVDGRQGRRALAAALAVLEAIGAGTSRG